MTYCNYAIVQLLTSYTWTAQRSIELLLWAQRSWMASKKQVWRPYVWTWGLAEANVLHWSSCDIVRNIRHPAVIRRPHSDSTPRELCPLHPVVATLITERSNAPQQIMLHSFNKTHTGTLGFWRGKIFNLFEILRSVEENE